MKSLSALREFAEITCWEKGAFSNKDTFVSGGISFAGEGFGEGFGEGKGLN